MKSLYTSADLALGYESWPGRFPYTRGIYESMYTKQPWTIRQYAGFASAKKSNEFYRDCLKQGQKGLSVAFDLPTHRGYDSDHPLMIGDVGKAGVAIDSVLDMKTLFDGINLAEVSVSMTMNGAVLPILAAFLVAAEESGAKPEHISGTIQNDILKEFLVRNTFIYPPQPSMRIVGDVIEYCSKFLPKFNSISISGYHIHEAGADLSLELGLTLADGLEYVRTAQLRGIEIDRFASRLSFFFATGMNFFMEIAKLRAARQLWARLMKDCGAHDDKSLLLRTHCQTSGWSLSAQDPLNNIVRTTIEALAAVLGGTQSLHTNSYDEALSLPTKTSSRIARNTQLILQHETNITSIIDPLGGSYYVESLTADLVNKAQEIIDKVAKIGGMTKALMSGEPMRWIEESSLRRQALIDSGQEIIVGVNKYQLDQEDSLEVLAIDNQELIKEQRQALKNLRAQRDNQAVEQALAKLTKAASSDNNLLELSINAMRKLATIGEVSSALEKAWGRFYPALSSVTGVYQAVYGPSKELEDFRKTVADFAKNHGRQPRILVAKLGQDGHDRGAKVIASAFADFGFDVDLSPLFQSPASVAQQAVDNDVHVIGLSTLAAGHNTLVPQLLAELELLKARDILLVVGGVVPPIDHEHLLKSGVALIFGPGTHVIEAARQILALLEAVK